MGSFRCWCLLLLTGALFGSGALAYPDEDDFWKKENDIQTVREDNWFQIDEEDGDMTLQELIEKYGYKVEIHSATTEDGYMLTLFRIMPRKISETKKLPVFVMHGLLGSAADFVISGPNNSLAYYLADDGYEVWLGNARGTRYSRRHQELPLHSEEYWDFSWHEIGYYDLPAMIDYVLNKTGSDQLQYIGHSQGTTTYFVMSSSRPEYNQKIALMTALSPAVVLKRIRSPILRVLLDLSDTIKEVLDSLHVFEFFPYNDNNHKVMESLCPANARDTICEELLGQLTGPHPESYSPKLAAAYMGHAPAGASTKQLMHFVQVVRTGLFRQYDNGRKENLQTYSNWKPPTYNLTASSAPVLIFYGRNDWMVHPKDVQEFYKMLPRVVAANLVSDRKFNHLDFILAKNARSEVYDKMRPVLEQYNTINNPPV
ncbi:AAEL012343-PA [Aedes aegypti]|uniref:Lipase n=1 Tax=Aedes aegypti TaxID=7159 RepID=Q16MC9_AEDAE|nr:AAEL012343-PA [Aedes aegypti]